ncbi:protein FAR1-RELATED SEQUENCE 5-like [Rosa sericea]
MEREEGDFVSIVEESIDFGVETNNSLDLNVEQDCHNPKIVHGNGTVSNVSSTNDHSVDAVVKVGTEFESDEHAYRCYNKYAKLVGFNVRKDWVNRSKVHGQVVSRKFTCSKEGYRRRDKRDVTVKKHRKETRTGCLAHMIITRQLDGKYRVSHIEEQHNHDNVNASMAQVLPLQRESSISQAVDAELVEGTKDFRTLSKLASESMNRRFRVRESLDNISIGYNNHLQSERTRDMKKGEVGRLLHYFQRQHVENPSFFYALQVDTDDKVCNIFWADDKMVSDYDYFGDVVCLDTICRTDKNCLPFVQIIGVNHHKQVLIFAAALLYDDTMESYKWLFQTFLEAMSGKKPRTILTDQDATIVEAIDSVLPETDHRICTWQMYENALKHISPMVNDTGSFANDFKRCIYDHKDEDDFVSAWGDMLDKYGLQQNDWLKWMFRAREKWAVVYGRNTIFVDKGAHLVESLFNDLRSYLYSDTTLLQFFKHFERVVDEQRSKEIEASDEMNSCLPRLMGNVVMLKHASNVYTSRAFEVFQQGYEKCLNVIVNQCSENGSLFEYRAKTFGKTQEHSVRFCSSDGTVICSCKKFESVGFLCSHALKVLDHRNIKVLPAKYVLKRWTKDARLGIARPSDVSTVNDNPKLIVASRYKDLSHRILMLSTRASESGEAFQYAVRQLDQVMEGVEKILTLKPEDAQAVTSSSTGTTTSDNEHAETFLDENAFENQGENGVKGANEQGSAVLDRGELMNVNGNFSSTDRIHISDASLQSNHSYISSEPLTGNPITQGLYTFEENPVVNCTYAQDNAILFRPPNIFPNQHDSPSQLQLLQEPLITGTYQEPISELRQAMDLDLHTPHSPSFLL